MVRRLAWMVAVSGCAGDPAGHAAPSGDDTTAGSTTTSTASSGAEPTTGGSSSSTTAATSTGALDDTGSSTGAPAPVVTTALVTDQNRHHPEMTGGWGPQLRGVMYGADGSRWFVADAGPSVDVNAAILYFRRDADGWAQVGSQDHLPGIQQNAASFLDATAIHSYAIDIVGHHLEHCAFAIDDAMPLGCAFVDIGGPYVTPASANYVGAVRGPDPVHLVWFTVVGAAGGPGQFIYAYDYGGGFNGPVTTMLPGYNDLGYVFASFRGPGEVVLAGQQFTGVYPVGTYDAVVVELVLGQTPSFVSLADGDGVDVRSAADVHVDPDSGATHVLAETDTGTLAYFFKPAGASWDDHRTMFASIPESFRGRFVAVAGEPLALVRGGASDGGIAVLRAAGSADVAIDWAAAESFALPDLGPGFAAPSALYVPARSYQDGDVDRLELVACGTYGIADGLLWHVGVDGW